MTAALGTFYHIRLGLVASYGPAINWSQRQDSLRLDVDWNTCLKPVPCAPRRREEGRRGVASSWKGRKLNCGVKSGLFCISNRLPSGRMKEMGTLVEGCTLLVRYEVAPERSTLAIVNLIGMKSRA